MTRASRLSIMNERVTELDGLRREIDHWLNHPDLTDPLIDFKITRVGQLEEVIEKLRRKVRR